MSYRSGDVVWADLNPSAGHEQVKRRPLVVVSNDAFNRHSTFTMTVPVTSMGDYPLHVDIGTVQDELGNPVRGFAEAEQLKSLDLESRNAVLVGRLADDKIELILEMVLGCLVSPDMTIISGY